MDFIKMLSGDTEIIKHKYTEGDVVLTDIDLQSEGFVTRPENVRFRYVFDDGGKDARIFAPSPCEGEYYIALQIQDTFGTYDEEFVPVKDCLCEPFEEKLIELSIGGKSIGTFRYGNDDRKYYFFFTSESVKLKKGDEISYRVLSGANVIFTAIVLTKIKPQPKTNAILNISTNDGHLRFTTRLASRVRIIAGDKTFEENRYFNNHKFEIPSEYFGIRLVIEAMDEGGNILCGRVTCSESEAICNEDKKFKVLLNGKDRGGEVQPVLSAIPLEKGVAFSAENIAVTDENGNVYPTEAKVTSRWQDLSIRTVAIEASLPLDGRNFYAENAVVFSTTDDFTAGCTENGIWVKCGDKEYIFNNESDSVLPDRDMFAVLYDENKNPFRATGGCFEITHSGVNRITVSRTNHFMKNGRRHMKCSASVTFYRGFDAYALEFGFENDLMEKEFTVIEGIYLEENGSYSEKIDLVQTDENTVYENGIEKKLRHDGHFTVNGENVLFVDFWQNYPKSVAEDENSLKIGICPFITKPELYRDEDFSIEARLFFYLKTGKYEFHCGLEKNHTVIFGKDAKKLSDIAFLQPDVSATEKSGAFGCIKCEKNDDFPEYDESMSNAMELFKNHRESWREYGMVNYGDSFGERDIHWTNEEYDFTCGMFVHFLRTGDERFYEMARSGAAHYAEVDFCHRSIHFEEDGYFFLHTVGHANNYYPFEKVPTSFREIKTHIGHIFVQGITEFYKATGIERYKKAVIACADSIAKYYTVKYDFVTEREPGWGMMALEAAYELTLDEYYLNACRIIVERVYQKQDRETGCLRYFMYKTSGEDDRENKEVCYGGKSFMHGIVGSAVKYYYYLTGDEKAKEICVGIARWLVDEMYDDEIQGFWYTEGFKQFGKKTNIPETNVEILDVILFAAYEDNKKEYLYAVERAFINAMTSPYRRECDVAKTFSQRLRFAPEIMYYYNKVKNEMN